MAKAGAAGQRPGRGHGASGPGRSGRARPSRGAKLLVLVVTIAALLFLVDRVVMFTVLRDYRAFLNDVAHYPEPDGVSRNSDGVRDTREATAFRESDLNVLFLGDSFVYGYRLWPHQAVPQQFERKARGALPERSIRAVNFGWVSASPYLSLRRLREIGAKYHPDVVLLCIDMTDFHDDIKYEKYSERPGLFKAASVLPSAFVGAKLLARALGGHEALFGYPAERFFVVNRPLEETREHLRPIRRNIEATASYAASELRASFAVIVLPRHFQYSERESPKDWERDLYTRMGPHVLEPFVWFEELGREVDYPVRSLLADFRRTEVFPTTFFGDPHWNADGAGVAADAILRILREEGLL